MNFHNLFMYWNHLLDLNAATEIFTQSAALGIQDNFSEINKAWAAVETLCVRRFESLQSLNKEIETVEENFTSAINESMDKLTLEVAALELVDKPSIMEFAQVLYPCPGDMF